VTTLANKTARLVSAFSHNNSPEIYSFSFFEFRSAVYKEIHPQSQSKESQKDSKKARKLPKQGFKNLKGEEASRKHAMKLQKKLFFS